MKYHLSIPEPCTAPWDDMAPCQQGRFCDKCQKTVIDFSNMSDAAIARIVSQQENICGRFSTEQLNRTISAAPQATNLKSLPRILALLLAPLLPTSGMAQQLHTTMQQIPEANGIKKVRISGTVWDSLSNKPMVGMLISTDKLGVKYSDAQGNFHFIVPEHLWNQEILFIAEYTNTSTPEIDQTTILPVTIIVNGTDTSIALARYPSGQLDPVKTYSNYLEMTVGIIARKVKLTRWQRIRYNIGKYFKRH